MEVFEVIYNEISAFFRTMDSAMRGGIIFAILMLALFSFLYSTRGSKKEKLIKNYFLFYFSIALALIGVAFTFI